MKAKIAVRDGNDRIMMIRTSNLNYILSFGIPFILIGLLIFLTKSSWFLIYPDLLSLGVTVDLLLTIPVVYYLLIRKTNIPKLTVVTFLVIGIILCSIILPTNHQYYFDLFKTWALPVVELSIFLILLLQIRKAIGRYRVNHAESKDFFTALKRTCEEHLPAGLVMPVVTELAVFYYAFISWKRRELKYNEFSYHKESGTIALMGVLIFLIGIETTVIHILVTKWSSAAAGVLTALSTYSALQFFGFLKSMSRRPITIAGGQLYLRYGIMNESVIDLRDIDHVEISSKDLERNKHNRKLSFLGDLESHNVILYLKEEYQLTGLYGITRSFQNVAVYVDNKLEFQSLIEKELAVIN